MVSSPVKNQLESTWGLPGEKESCIDRLQRQLHELEKRVDKYFDDLENVEEMCEQAKANIEKFQLRAIGGKELVKKDAEIQAKLYSAVKEKKMKREENDRERYSSACTGRQSARCGTECFKIYHKCSSVPLYQDGLRFGA